MLAIAERALVLCADGLGMAHAPASPGSLPPSPDEDNDLQTNARCTAAKEPNCICPRCAAAMVMDVRDIPPRKRRRKNAPLAQTAAAPTAPARPAVKESTGEPPPRRSSRSAAATAHSEPVDEKCY